MAGIHVIRSPLAACALVLLLSSLHECAAASREEGRTLLLFRSQGLWPWDDDNNGDEVIVGPATQKSPWSGNLASWSPPNGFVYAGSTLKFVWSKAVHNVLQLADQAAYDACDFTGATAVVTAATKASAKWRVAASAQGSTLFLASSVASDCASGLKVALPVLLPGRSIVVGDAASRSPWTAPLTWTPPTVYTGDRLVFKWRNAQHDVQLLPSEADYDACVFTAAQQVAPAAFKNSSVYTVPIAAADMTLWFSSSVGGDCSAGQKVAVPVVAHDAPATVTVGDESVSSPWSVDVNWTAPAVRIGDSLLFKWDSDANDVWLLKDAKAYKKCSFKGARLIAPLSPSATVLWPVPSAAAASTLFFSCSVPGRCAAGQKVAVDVD